MIIIMPTVRRVISIAKYARNIFVVAVMRDAQRVENVYVTDKREGGERERERERERQTDRQTDRQTETERDTERERERDRQTDRQTDRELLSPQKKNSALKKRPAQYKVSKETPEQTSKSLTVA